MAIKTVADSAVLQSLIDRLNAIEPNTPRRWGTLTAHEMLCHIGDACAMVIGTRPRKVPVRPRRGLLMKWVWIWTPIPWPHGVPTNPLHDPRAEGTRPSDFAKDLARAVSGIRGIAASDGRKLEPLHGLFGRMSLRDWQRWAWRHTDYHLRQFGL